MSDGRSDVRTCNNGIPCPACHNTADCKGWWRRPFFLLLCLSVVDSLSPIRQLMVFWSSMCSAFKSSQSVITCTSLIRSSWSYFRHIFHHSMANSTGMEGCWRKICWWLQLRCASFTRSCFAGLDHQISCFVWGSFTFPRLNMKSPPLSPVTNEGRQGRLCCPGCRWGGRGYFDV